MDPLDPLGPLETRVMEALWRAGTATAREVFTQLDEAWAYTTVMTTLDRLHKKALLTREKEGLAYRYQPALPRDALVRAQVDALASRLLGEGREMGLAALVDAADEETLDRLAALIAARRRG